MVEVIDISEYQVRRGPINWAMVRASGITGVMIRIGWAGYEGPIAGNNALDQSLDASIRGAYAAGLNVGLYVYTYTRTPAAAEVAAAECVSIAKRYPGVINMPIAFDVEEVKHFNSHEYVYTGSPHHVQFVDDLEHFDVKNEGARLRYSDLYDASGCNINFVEQLDADTFSVRTYERGVEDETLSCGTGATGVAIAMHSTYKTDAKRININVLGGKLTISFEVENNNYKNVFLTGPAELVFGGSLEV